MNASEIETLRILLQSSKAMGIAIAKIASLQNRITQLEDECNKYAEDFWGNCGTTSVFVPPYPDNPLTKERRERTK